MIRLVVSGTKNKNMRIILKPRNQPKEPGYYLCLRSYPVKLVPKEKPEVFEIREQSGLWMFGAMTAIPLSRCEHSALWSDRIEIDYPEGHGQP